MATKPHTPGPWSIWTSCSYRRIGSDATLKEVAVPVIQRSDGHPDIWFPNGGEDGPDARLLSAAPDLLAACELAQVIMRRLHYIGPEREIFAAAITKARGE